MGIEQATSLLLLITFLSIFSAYPLYHKEKLAHAMTWGDMGLRRPSFLTAMAILSAAALLTSKPAVAENHELAASTVFGYGECLDCASDDYDVFGDVQVAVVCKGLNGEFESIGSSRLSKEGKFGVKIRHQDLISMEENGGRPRLKRECYAQLFSNSRTSPCPVSKGPEHFKIIVPSSTIGERKSYHLPLTVATESGKLSFSRAACSDSFLWPHPLLKPGTFQHHGWSWFHHGYDSPPPPSPSPSPPPPSPSLSPPPPTPESPPPPTPKSPPPPTPKSPPPPTPKSPPPPSHKRSPPPKKPCTPPPSPPVKKPCPSPSPKPPPPPPPSPPPPSPPPPSPPPPPKKSCPTPSASPSQS